MHDHLEFWHSKCFQTVCAYARCASMRFCKR